MRRKKKAKTAAKNQHEASGKGRDLDSRGASTTKNEGQGGSGEDVRGKNEGWT